MEKNIVALVVMAFSAYLIKNNKNKCRKINDNSIHGVNVMALLKSLVLSKKTPESGIARHTSFTHFLDLIDACGFDLKVSSIVPNIECLNVYRLIFVDVSDYSQSFLFQHPLFNSPYVDRIVLFGVPKTQQDIELKAIKAGIKGVFYFEDKLEIVIKGIQNIKNDKFWFKRDTLEVTVQKFLNDANQHQRIKTHHDDCNNSLTKRERMIVDLIGQGAKNIEIAEQLHISINTVKTHVYSIFRKTDCRNRVELIKWSLQDGIVSN